MARMKEIYKRWGKSYERWGLSDERFENGWYCCGGDQKKRAVFMIPKKCEVKIFDKNG